jgi:hypothetical protein
LCLMFGPVAFWLDGPPPCSSFSLFANPRYSHYFQTYRVVRVVTEHLVSQRSANFWRMLLWTSCWKRNYSPTICTPTESWIL